MLSADGERQVQTTVVWSELDGEAILPCHISTPAGDKVNMVFWYSDQIAGIPIYRKNEFSVLSDSLAIRQPQSPDCVGYERFYADRRAYDYFYKIYDMRETADAANGIHMAFSVLEKRCSFTPPSGGPDGGSLKISKVTQTDAGSYKCRIDFANSPTQQSKVTLSLIDLPSEPIIETLFGAEAAEDIGPYHESDPLTLRCYVTGGNPTPQLSWWIVEGHERLAGYVKDTGPSTITSNLVVHSIPPHYNQKTLQCRVNVTGSSTVLTRNVRLNVYVKPSEVSILNRNNVIVDGESTKFVCNCFGSNPSPLISWLLDGEPIRSSAITVAHLNNTITTSTLTIRADPSFDERLLFCKCENEEFPGYHIQDERKLQVHYKPMMQIVTRTKYNNFNKVKEGDNVTLECAVNANPAVNAVRWFHNDKVMEETNKMLQLTDITLDSTGEYECEAANKEGASKSSKLALNILHKPFCVDGTENQSLIAALHETVILQCEVESGGSVNRHLQFFWSLNNSRTVRSMDHERIQSAGKISIMRYTSETENDFGTVACWAQNDVGLQRTPCYFRLALANKPDRPRNCVTNSSVELVKVFCEPGFDGGLKQYFVLEVRIANGTSYEDVGGGGGGDFIVDQPSNDQASVFDGKQTKPLFKMQKEHPIFDVFSLQNGVPYLLILYAVNLKGRSDPVVLLQEIKSTLGNGVTSEMNAVSQDAMTLPSIYLLMISSIVVMASLVVLTAVILACRTTRSTMMPCNGGVGGSNDLNNFRIAYSDVVDDKATTTNYESEF